MSGCMMPCMFAPHLQTSDYANVSGSMFEIQATQNSVLRVNSVNDP